MRCGGNPQLCHEDRVRLLVVDTDLVQKTTGLLKISAAARKDLNESVTFARHRPQGSQIGVGHKSHVISRSRCGCGGVTLGGRWQPASPSPPPAQVGGAVRRVWTGLSRRPRGRVERCDRQEDSPRPTPPTEPPRPRRCATLSPDLRFHARLRVVAARPRTGARGGSASDSRHLLLDSAMLHIPSIRSRTRRCVRLEARMP